MDYADEFDYRLGIFMDERDIKDSNVISVIRLDRDEYEIWVRE